ncbi:MAG: outer spore coat protein CotE, partial [Turicibacter sp.]
ITIQQPTCVDARIEDGEIVVEVEFEIVVEVIGETKMRVSILGPVESDCDTDDEEDEIDQQINPNFLKNSPFRGE